LANEFAHFCEEAGIDFVEACNVVNPQSRHCLQIPAIVEVHAPNDSLLLLEEADSVNTKLRLLTLARKINDETLDHTLHLVRDALRACQKPLRRAKISVFGVSSRPNMKESRGSPTKKLVYLLRKRGASVQVYDPFFSYKELSEMGYSAETTFTKTIEGADCIIITIGHDKFRRLNLRRIKLLSKKPVAIVDMGHVVDPAKVEEEGFVYLVDRKKDLVICGGENIYPVEVEEVIQRHPKIHDVAVIGTPDRRLGEIVAAIIQPVSGEALTESEVKAFCEEHLPRYKRPRRIIFGSVPRSPTGKIEKPKLRAKHGQS